MSARDPWEELGPEFGKVLEHLINAEFANSGIHAKVFTGKGVQREMRELAEKEFQVRMERVWGMYMAGRRECGCDDPACQTTLLLQIFAFADKQRGNLGSLLRDILRPELRQAIDRVPNVMKPLISNPDDLADLIAIQLEQTIKTQVKAGDQAAFSAALKDQLPALAALVAGKMVPPMAQSEMAAVVNSVLEARAQKVWWRRALQAIGSYFDLRPSGNRRVR